MASQVSSAVLNDIRFSTKGNQQKIIFDLSVRFQYTQFILTRPERVVVDFKDTQLKVNLAKLKYPHDLIKSIRSSKDAKGRLRIVLDLNSTTKTTVARLGPVGEFGHRLLLQLTKPAKKISHQAALTTALNESLKPGKAVKVASVRKLRDVVVVLDPGHGGKDPGATGKRGTREKDVVLTIAKRVKTYIDKQPGMRAVLTRKGDYYIPLRKRLAIAREQDADIFISIHADAFKNRKSNGASVFALSPRGATSEAARWLAEKENYSELGGVNLAELDDKSGLIRSVLIDLSQTATIGSSIVLGQQVLNYIDDITSLHHSKVEQARFVVLKSPDIPSILIETGFISNPREERNLRSSWYQKRLARSIVRGLKRFFWLHPPAGTFVEVQSKTKTHIVSRGETLSGLSVRYNVSSKALQALNQLKSTQLKIGQKIKIPSKSIA